MRPFLQPLTVEDARFPFILGGIFAVEFVLLGISPHDRSDWLLENAISLPFALGLLLSARRRPLSRGAYLGIFMFLGLHEIGSHYTYSLVPYDDAFRRLTGRSLNAALGWERNHYDRLVHLAFGLLCALPLREALRRVIAARPRVLHAVTFAVVLAVSATYEMLEWGAAQVFGRDLGIAFVGAQGDPWDAQKDSALAAAGALVALAVPRGLRRKRVRLAVVSSRAAVLALAALMTLACTDAARLVRPHTYPPDFRYLEREQVQSVMWRLAGDAHALDVLMRDPAPIDEARRREVSRLLAVMLHSTHELGSDNRRTNHPLLDANLASFRADLQQAQREVESDSPDYFYVGTVTGACVHCHTPRP